MSVYVEGVAKFSPPRLGRRPNLINYERSGTVSRELHVVSFELNGTTHENTHLFLTTQVREQSILLETTSRDDSRSIQCPRQYECSHAAGGSSTASAMYYVTGWICMYLHLPRLIASLSWTLTIYMTTFVYILNHF